MGTLGCVNDMLQRDKQNRELRKAGRNRMKDTYNRLLQLGHKTETPAISPEKMSEIRPVLLITFRPYTENRILCLHLPLLPDRYT